GDAYADLPFSVAIALLTRVISKPGKDRLCLDLGYKSVASEMPLESRIVIPAIPDAKFIGHSEEHLVIETSHASDVSLGTAFLAFPRHVCPTVALHDFLTLVRDGQATGELWPVTARGRFLI
ncbi:MAG: D-TA family PLP-dependent enzyme, partial [Rubripirellula sp.]